MARDLVDVELANDPMTVTVGRRALARAVRADCEDIVDEASLVTSELLANAVEHTDGPVRLRASHGPGVLRIEVHDLDARTSMVRTPTRDDEDGRGLLIVDEVASRWGAESTDLGKVVWAELDF